MRSVKRSHSAVTRTGDRRVLKTRSLLHAALFGLMGEREYHRISVSQILERANVGRSTFYTHFRDKEALFASAVQEMLESIRATSAAAATLPAARIVGFARPLFEHIERHRSAGGVRMGQQGRAVLHEHVRRILTQWIAEEMSRDGTRHGGAKGRFPPDLLAQYVASTFVLVLDWWVDRKCVPSPAEADVLFRSLVTPAVRPSSTPSASSWSSRGNQR